MDPQIVAHVLHVISIALLVGGLALLALAVEPALRNPGGAPAEDRLLLEVQARFGALTRLALLGVFLSGLWMLSAPQRNGFLGGEGHPGLHLALLCWAAIALVLFVLQPLLLARWRQGLVDGAAAAAPEAEDLPPLAADPQARLRRITRWQRLHLGLLGIALVALLGGSLEAHGQPIRHMAEMPRAEGAQSPELR